jgi:hypothetical protein
MSITTEEQTTHILVRQAWSAQLGSDTFGDDDPFFLVGGDSQKAVKLMKELSLQAGRKLGVRLIFQHQTVRKLAAAIEASGGAQASQAPALSAVPAVPVAPMPAAWVGSARLPLDPDTAFNGFVAANVLFALENTGLLQALADGPVAEADLCAGLNSAGPALLAAARSLGYLTREGSMVRLTEAGREMLRMRGFFTWAVGGYHDVFRQAGGLARGTLRFGADVRRDEAAVALGSGEAGSVLMRHILDDVLVRLDFEHVADLGSGNCSRLLDIVGGRSRTRATGYDISVAATGSAQTAIGTAGEEFRVEAVHADVGALLRRPAPDARARDVDMVMSFFLLHDLLADPAERPHVLPRLREAFPAADTFVLADTMLREGSSEPDSMPIFTAGFELAHALMGVPLHTKTAYEELFAAAGLRASRVLPFGAPHSWLYVLKAA